MSASCYVGCTAPPVKPPSVGPTVVPHTPLAFTGAGPGIHELAVVGILLLLAGAAVLAYSYWRKHRTPKAPYQLAIDTSPRVMAAWLKPALIRDGGRPFISPGVTPPSIATYPPGVVPPIL